MTRHMQAGDLDELCPCCERACAECSSAPSVCGCCSRDCGSVVHEAARDEL